MASKLTRAQQCKRPRQLDEAASSSEYSHTVSLLQSIDGDQQIGSLENFHQFVENALVVLGSGLKVFLKYALRFTHGLKRQLLISHRPTHP